MSRSASVWPTGLAALFLTVSPFVRAHHSFAMFDDKKEVALKGEVAEFQWQNPHTYVQLVSDADKVNWTIELAGASGLVRDHWKPGSLAAGDKITVHIHPLRNGAPGGALIWLEKADGTVLGKKPGDVDHYAGATAPAAARLASLE